MPQEVHDPYYELTAATQPTNISGYDAKHGAAQIQRPHEHTAERHKQIQYKKWNQKDSKHENLYTTKEPLARPLSYDPIVVNVRNTVNEHFGMAKNCLSEVIALILARNHVDSITVAKFRFIVRCDVDCCFGCVRGCCCINVSGCIRGVLRLQEVTSAEASRPCLKRPTVTTRHGAPGHHFPENNGDACFERA
jgi:hypothetical protein